MRIERQTRRSPSLFGCGCLIMMSCAIVAGVALLLVLPVLPGLVIQVAGFESSGSTDDVFRANTPPPPVVVEDAGPPPQQAFIDFGAYGTQSLNNNLYDYNIAIGSTTATVSFSEQALMAICQQQTTLCSSGNSQVRNAQVDLRPGGAVVYADVFIPQVAAWQRAGVVLSIDGSRRQLQVAGIDMNGQLFSTAADGLGATIAEIERTANDILRQLSLNAGGERYNLSEVRADDTTLTLILRG